MGEDVWCLEDGTCKDGCIVGKYGAKCNKDCPNKDRCLACSQLTGHCIKCTNGTYGKTSHCDKSCGHCKTGSKSEIECSILTGNCTHGCISGYYSPKCDKKCGHCMPNPDKCNLLTGFCENGCVDGYFGQRCDDTCGHCQPNPDGTLKCDRDTGECQSCVSGYYGQGCNQKCKRTCSDSITNQVRCDKSSGNCTFGCTPGFYGNNCEKICSNTCKDNLCTTKDGHCQKGCISDWYGEFCNERCNINCINSSCTQKVGYCKTGCKSGWYGDTCNKTCSINCRNSSCAQTLGHCDNGCILGKHGNTCNNVCSLTCSNTSCDQYSGNCDKGCRHEWFGIKCENKCSSSCLNTSCDQYSGLCNEGCIPKYYGDICELSCPEHCKEDVCDRQIASCLLGCKQGYRGVFCDETLEQNCSNQFVIGFTGGLIGFAITFVLFLVRWLAKSLVLKRRRYAELDMSTRENVLPIYEEIPENIERSEQRETAASHFYAEVAPLQRITQVSDTSTQCNYEVPVKQINETSMEGALTHSKALGIDLTMRDNMIMTVENSILMSNNSDEDKNQSILNTSGKYYEISDISNNQLHGLNVTDKPAHHICDYPSFVTETFCGIGLGIKAISFDQLEYGFNKSSQDSDICKDRKRPHSDSERILSGERRKFTTLTIGKIIKDKKYNDISPPKKPKDTNELNGNYVNMNLDNDIKSVLDQNISLGQLLTEKVNHQRPNTRSTMTKTDEQKSFTSPCNSYVDMGSFPIKCTKEIKNDNDNESVNYLHPTI
ncbi:multiple epidermal growth factor-like domains protein 11 [Ruditapes philippinarum]|uniref:multiple epidermal growth factor-like domains protein 11 n=1 Tax=Ruditapes philippinarum TaxID=129788 RepID=UPI00295B25D6|nr:multiple epidermal growth factor-like domains protein 11 [Ruditapes philippinarum]